MSDPKLEQAVELLGKFPLTDCPPGPTFPLEVGTGRVALGKPNQHDRAPESGGCTSGSDASRVQISEFGAFGEAFRASSAVDAAQYGTVRNENQSGEVGPLVKPGDGRASGRSALPAAAAVPPSSGFTIGPAPWRRNSRNVVRESHIRAGCPVCLAQIDLDHKDARAHAADLIALSFAERGYAPQVRLEPWRTLPLGMTCADFDLVG